MTSCKKENESITTESIGAYLPLEIGNSITYSLDSTTYIKFGSEKKVSSYTVKDIVDSMITDNLGRASYKIRRKIRNTLDSTRWEDLSSYLVTYHNKRLELIQDNQRYLKLIEPIKNNVEWSGNSYINTISNPELQYLDQWKYYYTDVGMPFTNSAINFPETISIIQRNDVLGDTLNKDYYFEVNYSKEVYAKGIGLIYKDFLHEAWQPKNASSSTGYYESNSYGIKLTILDRNF
jgi:hypothetical protein